MISKAFIVMSLGCPPHGMTVAISGVSAETASRSPGAHAANPAQCERRSTSSEGCGGPQQRTSSTGSAMIEFDVKCERCRKPITLRVCYELARAFFEKHGAFCEACYKPGDQAAPMRRAA